MKKWLVSVLLCLSSVAAHASLITIDPENYAPGTNISHQFPGVTLSTIVTGNGAVVRQDVFSVTCGSHPLCPGVGSNIFGYESGTSLHGGFYSEASAAVNCLGAQPSEWCTRYNQQFLDIRFDNPTDYVAVESAHFSDWPMFWAFDALGNLLQVDEERIFTAPWPNNNFETTILTATIPNISRLVVSGSLGTVRLDSITYASVPEPGTFGLLALGMFGVLMMSRRRAARLPCSRLHANLRHDIHRAATAC
jgi:hypothetical protein